MTGVDYLAVIAERHRRHLHRRLRLADPSGVLADLRGWPLINVITGSKLLACGRLIHNDGAGHRDAQNLATSCPPPPDQARTGRRPPPPRLHVDHGAIVTATASTPAPRITHWRAHQPVVVVLIQLGGQQGGVRRGCTAPSPACGEVSVGDPFA